MTYLKTKSPIERTLSIVKQLYTLEKVTVKGLSEKYGVCTKTIYRDLKKIASIIPLAKVHNIYFLDSEKLLPTSSFQDKLLRAFASNAEVEYFDKSNLSEEKIAFAIEYNHLPKKMADDLMHCIDNECKVEFIYKKPTSISKRVVSPVKFYTEKERWYLLAKDDKDAVLKTFYFGKIHEFKALKDTPVTLTAKDRKEANEKKSVWSDCQKDEFLVEVYVKPDVAEYFRDGKLHKSQTIENEHCDGGLEVHYSITHKMEILPQIKGYIPHLFILEPKWLHDEMMRELEFYRDEDWKMDI